MNDLRNTARFAMGVLGVTEASAASQRFAERGRTYATAQSAARASNRRFVVVGDPNSGIHTRLQAAYGCGDVCVDLTGCPACPTGVVVDLTSGRMPLEDNTGIVFCSCVLEYVSDPHAAWREMVRVAGSPFNVYLVTVQPDTLTSVLYPGARWKIVRRADGGIDAYAVSTETKLATAAALGLGAYLSY